MIELTHTDLPEPVAPAMRRWGLHQVHNLGFPGDVLPEYDRNSIRSTKESAERFRTYDRSVLVRAPRFLLHACLEWVLRCGHWMRQDGGLCWPRKVQVATILRSFTPGAGRISNIRMTGPFRMPVTSAFMPNSSRVSLSTSEAVWFRCL